MLVSSLFGPCFQGCVPDAERFPHLTLLFKHPLGADPTSRSFERHLYNSSNPSPCDCPISGPAFRSRGDFPGDPEAQVNSCRSRRDDVAGTEGIPPSRLHIEAVAAQADELHPPLIRQQVGLLALLEVLVADPKFTALTLVPAGIVDHQDRA